MAQQKVRWGILGPGGIAREFFRGADGSGTGVVTTVGTRNPAKSDLVENFPGLRVHGSYDDLLADPEVDAIYIATPHPFHAEWAVRAADHGKHVLCEKPLAMNAAEVRTMFDAAKRNGTFLGEAYMYRLHPLTNFILQLLRDGKVGEVRMIKSSFGFAIPAFLPDHRLFSRELGGGAILDLGGYPMSMARLIAGYENESGVTEPVHIQGLVRKGPTDVEEIASALVTFPNGIIAELSCSLALWQDNVLHIQGTAGRLEVESFWFGSGKYGGTARIRFVHRHDEPEIITFEESANVYSFQFEAANEAIRSGRTQFGYPGMSEADSLGNAAAIDRWFQASASVTPPLPKPA